MNSAPDIYYKKEITYDFAGIKFRFAIANTLFSTFDMDHGTDILIRSIHVQKPKTILDIGCGYGPLGITLAKTNPHSEVTLVDRDLLAVRYTKINAEINELTNVRVMGSLGMESIKNEFFDLIVSNIPAKIGDQAIRQEFLYEPYNRLNRYGEYWFVIISSLNRIIPIYARDIGMKLEEVRRRHGHIVYRVTKNS